MGKNINYSDSIIYKNSILSASYKIVSVILSLISAPLLLYCLGEEKYGVWATVLSFISWIYYFDLGIGNGLRNKLASSIAIGDNTTSRKYLSTAYVLICKMSFLIFLIAIFLFNIFDITAWLQIDIQGENIRLCIIIALLLACINFVMSLVNNILFALQKASLVSFFNCFSQAIFVLLLTIYAISGIKSILFIAIGEGCAQLIKNFIETFYVIKRNLNFKFSLKDYDKTYKNGILSFGIQMFLVQIAALVLNSTDNILITKLFGASAVTPYNFCYKYFNMIQTMYVALIAPLTSAYTAAFTLKDFAWIYKNMKRNIVIFILFTICSIIASFIFKPFALVWLKRNLNFDFILIICTLIYFIILMFNHIFSTFLTGISCIKETTIATMIGTIMNIPVSIFLARNMGMGTAGIILGSVISLCLITIVAPIITRREFLKMKGEK